MLLTPRYGEPVVLRFDGPVGDPSVTLIRQRRRLGEVLAGLDDDQWAAPSRCALWSVQDVISHLAGTDQFWALSFNQGLAGDPTRFLAAFDPVTTPPQLVDQRGNQSPAEVLAAYLDSSAQFAAVVGAVDEAQWSVLAEAPPGHIALHAVARHALWDAWIHERDVMLPLGMTPAVEPDEVRACLEYVAALGPGFLATAGSTRAGTLVIDGTDPDLRFVIELGEVVVVHDGDDPDAPRLTGPSVDLVEALSFRAPLPHDLDEADRWMLGGLAAVFDAA